MDKERCIPLFFWVITKLQLSLRHASTVNSHRWISLISSLIWPRENANYVTVNCNYQLNNFKKLKTLILFCMYYIKFSVNVCNANVSCVNQETSLEICAPRMLPTLRNINLITQGCVGSANMSCQNSIKLDRKLEAQPGKRAIYRHYWTSRASRCVAVVLISL